MTVLTSSNLICLQRLPRRSPAMSGEPTSLGVTHVLLSKPRKRLSLLCQMIHRTTLQKPHCACGKRRSTLFRRERISLNTISGRCMPLCGANAQTSYNRRLRLRKGLQQCQLKMMDCSCSRQSKTLHIGIRVKNTVLILCLNQRSVFSHNPRVAP